MSYIVKCRDKTDRKITATRLRIDRGHAIFENFGGSEHRMCGDTVIPISWYNTIAAFAPGSWDEIVEGF